MNIGIDARLLNNKITGINRYLLNLLKYLPEYDKGNKYFLYQYKDSGFYHPFFNITYLDRSDLPRQIYEHFWLHFRLPSILKSQKIDLFFTPYLLVPLRSANYKNIIVIHDTVTKSCKNSHTLYYRKYMDFLVPLMIKRADKVVTVSNSARRDLIRYFQVDPVKIDYMHLWTDERYHPREMKENNKKEIRKKYNLPEKFVLYVGVIEERKNIEGILKISDELYSRGKDIKFVLIGSKGFGYLNLIRKIKGRGERIIYHNWIDEQDLPLIYTLATVFLFPSNYEGFGLPPLEAMKSGLPVLTSNISSLPEIIGDGGLMFPPGNYSDFADNILKLLENEQFYSVMKQKALIQAEKFNPAKQISKLISIFNEFSS